MQTNTHHQDSSIKQAQSQPGATPLVQIKHLSIHFGQASVLRKVNLTIGTGQTLAIVGESGSGKSLTALSLLHLLPSNADLDGEILLENAFNDQPSDKHAQTDITFLDALSMQQIRGAQIAMIFQEPMSSLNPVITCGQQIVEAILAHTSITYQAAKERTLQLFKEVQLPEPDKIFAKYPHQISGGQKQRVMIAMAMSCDPRLLICDEPTTALDVMVQKEILQLIDELKQKNNMSVLFISHDIQLVAAIADQIAVLYKGDLVEVGPADQIITRPQHPYTRALLSCRPGLYESGQRLPVVSDFLVILNKPAGQTAAVKTASNESAPDATVTALGSTTGIQPLKPVQKPENQGAQIKSSTQSTQTRLATTAEHSTILAIEHLQVWYPDTAHRDFWGRPTGYHKAIQDLSLQVKRGETLGLVGGSGCGKTTLGRAVMGLTPVHSGKILYKGQNWLQRNGNSASKAQQMQMIFQDPYSALNPRLTIGRAIGEALQVHGKLSSKEVKAMVCEWLEKVGLQAAHYDRYPHEFSGGQRQRIVIARALILRPDFVICDESVSALDVSVQAQILNLFNDLKAELGFTSIFISHDLSVVRYISDRIAVMHKGRIEELGPAASVYHHPVSPYTEALLAASNASILRKK
ncbi:dipeptide ABC transporter ATP-binding protein [Arachidicoccus ginsenosidivorans]|uniref:dipeptide ABC transporter ATP-binding protein n=1 Tax=Arachidicoccus ginsenosidivorans TaxID=496057 RepID=UPI001CEF90C7|nr:ABC transporter ATP-binding protein [Arachidicoccus ginsenosidivorans]